MVKLIFAVLLRSQVDSEVAFMVIFQLIELEIVTLLHNLSALSAVLWKLVALTRFVFYFCPRRSLRRAFRVGAIRSSVNSGDPLGFGATVLAQVVWAVFYLFFQGLEYGFQWWFWLAASRIDQFKLRTQVVNAFDHDKFGWAWPFLLGYFPLFLC
jgi:hypothetical protein